jgi:hypothetical protein
MADKYVELVRNRVEAELKKEFDITLGVQHNLTILNRVEKTLKDADALVGTNHPKIKEDLDAIAKIRRELGQPQPQAATPVPQSGGSIPRVQELLRQADLQIEAAAEDHHYGRRPAACAKLRQAKQLLDQAAAASPHDSSVAEKLGMVRQFLKELNC